MSKVNLLTGLAPVQGMETKVDALIRDIRGILRKPVHDYTERLLNQFERSADGSPLDLQKDQGIKDTKPYKEARERVLNDIQRALTPVADTLNAESITEDVWVTTLSAARDALGKPIQYLRRQCPHVRDARGNPDALGTALIQALRQSQQRINNVIGLEALRKSKLSLGNGKAEESFGRAIQFGTPVPLPLSIRVSPDILPDERMAVEAIAGSFRPSNEHSYQVRSGELSVAGLDALIRMPCVEQVGLAGPLRAAARPKAALKLR